MSEFKLPELNHDTDTVSASLGLTDERTKELEDSTIKRIKEAPDGGGSTSEFMELVIADCKTSSELTYMAFRAGAYVEKMSNPLMSMLGGGGL